MAEVSGMTADHLLNGDNTNGRRVVTMKDWELLEKMDKKDRNDHLELTRSGNSEVLGEKIAGGVRKLSKKTKSPEPL